jgi:hypothetical protein
MAPQERIGFGKGVRIGRDRQRVARGRDVNVTYRPLQDLASVGRYDDGIHIECATGGCGPGDPLVVHDDTISPWTGDFTFGAVLTGNFWEHGFVDLVGGTICNCVFPQ